MKNEPAFPVNDIDLINTRLGLTRLELTAVLLVHGYLSSGRNETVIDGRPIKIEEAAILRAKNLLALLEKENK